MKAYDLATSLILVPLSWCLVASSASAQSAEPSITGGSEASATSPQADAATPAGKKVKRKKLKASSLPVPPADPLPIVETTKIEPELIYRMAKLVPQKESVYKKDDSLTGDFFDQIYMTLRFSRTYDYVHEVVLEPTIRTTREKPSSWDTSNFADQAYLESAVNSWLTLTVGKKTEFSGFGFFVNPSDLLNEHKENFDSLYQREGVVFGRLRARFGDFSLGLGFIPERGAPSSEGRGWVTLAGQVAEVDMSLAATHHQSEKTTVGFSAQRFFGSSFELHTDSRYQAKQRYQTSGNTEPQSAYAGPNTEINADDDPSAYFLNGTRYVITHQRSAVFEYIVNQSGLLPEEFVVYHDDLRRKKEESKTNVKEPPKQILGRHYVFVGYSDEGLAKGMKLSLNALQNTDDKSTFVSLSARYHLSPITSVELAPTFFQGERDSEFGEMPFAAVTYLTFRGRF